MILAIIVKWLTILQWYCTSCLTCYGRYQIPYKRALFGCSSIITTLALQSGLCSTHFFGLTRLWLIWQSRWLNSDSTQSPNLLTWLNSDSTHLSQSWVKSDSRLIIFYLIWEKVVDRGGGVRSNVAVGWFFLCNVTDNCKILTFSLQKISDSTLTQAVSSWLNSDSNDNQRDSTLTRLISWIFTADSTLTRLIWVRVESNLTHDSWVEHNPVCNTSAS